MPSLHFYIHALQMEEMQPDCRELSLSCPEVLVLNLYDGR